MATKTSYTEKAIDKGVLLGNEAVAEAARALQQAADKLVEFSKDALTDASDELSQGMKVADKALQDGVKKSEKLIKKYPLESALVCFGAGCLVGLLLKGRD